MSISQRKYYRLDGVSPKDGETRDVHLAVAGKKCWFESLDIGQRATIWCEVYRNTGNYKTLHTSAVLGVRETEDSSIEIETLNSIYLLVPLGDT